MSLFTETRYLPTVVQRGDGGWRGPPFPERLGNGKSPLKKKLHPIAHTDRLTHKQTDYRRTSQPRI